MDASAPDQAVLYLSRARPDARVEPDFPDPSTAETQQVYKKLDTDREDTLSVLFDWREI